MEIINEYDWYNEPIADTRWLVDGLIPADGYTAIVGKPKAGKSTAIRNLIVAVIKGQEFLGREVEISPNSGRVLYLQLDRKDKPGRVTAELRKLGLSAEDAPRLIVRLAEHLPSTGFSERLDWLKKEVTAANPNLIVIDLLWQFVIAKNSNDYNAVLDGINKLQDALIEIGYKGALVVAIHGRKANNPDDPSDDILGSTGQRASFSTIIILGQNKTEGIYTVSSDQTERDDVWGEIPETVIRRNDDGTLSLGQPIKELAKAEKKAKLEEDYQRFYKYVDDHPGCVTKDITRDLGMSNATVLRLLPMTALIRRDGKGVKGDPHRYCAKGFETPSSFAAVPIVGTQALECAEGTLHMT